MHVHDIENLSRRRFLKQGLAAGVGLTLGVQLSGGSRLAAADASTPTALAPNAFVRIGTDDRVTIIVKHLEMGQGTYTGLPTLLAEELDARWDQVRVEGAPADPERYNNLFWGPTQGTGGSTSIANSWEQMRKAGATARRMLVEAAARRWRVEPETIQVIDGVLSHGDALRASFGELAAEAARLPVPEEVALKDPSAFRLIGKANLRRKDTAAKIDGSARYTQDAHLPGLLTAVVAHPPRFGAAVRSFDPEPALALDGVEKVVQIPSGVAVLATDFWTAKRGRDRLTIEWDERDAFKLGSDEILAQYRALSDKPGIEAVAEGDADAALAAAAGVVEADFEVPYLAHAAMEPLNCVIVPEQGGGVLVINGEQSQTRTQAAVAHVLDIEPSQVRIDMLYAGSSFGRRGNPQADFTSEAAEIFKAAGGSTPIKMQWTREDDTRAGWYRPLFFHRVRAGIDQNGKPVAWKHRIVGQSIAVAAGMEALMVVDGVDRLSVEGASNLAYRIPNRHVDLHSPDLPVPIQWWRSVGHTHTAMAVECVIDELAAMAGQDAVAYRMALLEDQPRHRGVLRLAADKAGWGTPLEEGRGRGVAVHESFGSYVAQVAEVTVRGTSFTVDRVVIAVDCGLAINPDVIEAQMEGGMGYGLSAALLSALTLKEGRVQQSSFHDYQVLRMDQMPTVEVHIVPSTEPPTGVGEPATPVIAPAVANALAAATGQRLRRLPLRLA